MNYPTMDENSPLTTAITADQLPVQWTFESDDKRTAPTPLPIEEGRHIHPEPTPSSSLDTAEPEGLGQPIVIPDHGTSTSARIQENTGADQKGEPPHTNSGTDAPCRHRLYDITGADAVFTTNDCMFRVHSYFFTRKSPYFRRLWKVMGATAETPIDLSNDGPVSGENDATAEPYYVALDEVTTEELELLLWVFYNPDYSIYEATT
ncbi:hypothetical protein H4582DRAFT_980870 [Lactarius indigo]|nr:hypothetical protein H4582DRAFT_980870 [Lactarius indigo]